MIAYRFNDPSVYEWGLGLYDVPSLLYEFVKATPGFLRSSLQQELLDLVRR